MSTQPGWTDQQLDQIVGNLLRAGVLIAAAVVCFGAILYLSQHGTEREDYASFQGEPPALENVRSIAADAWRLTPLAVIQFGLLLLLATPVARVLMLVVGFAIQRDRLYVVVSLFVLGVLLLSIMGYL